MILKFGVDLFQDRVHELSVGMHMSIIFFEGTVAELIRKIPGKATSSNLSRLSRFKQGLMNSQIYRRGHAWSIIYCGLMYLLSSVNVKQDFTSEYPAQMDLLIHVC